VNLSRACLGKKEPACKLSVASVEDRGEGEGCTGSLSEM
jgi:hypothetical protein